MKVTDDTRQRMAQELAEAQGYKKIPPHAQTIREIWLELKGDNNKPTLDTVREWASDMVDEGKWQRSRGGGNAFYFWPVE